VLNALKAHDDVLADELDQIRTEMGRKSGSAFNAKELQQNHHRFACHQWIRISAAHFALIWLSKSQHLGTSGLGCWRCL